MQQAKKQRVMYWLSFRGGLIMMKRKLTSLFLATAMVMTTLAGCGNSGGKPAAKVDTSEAAQGLSLIHISEPTRRTPISYAVFCLKKKKIKKPLMWL